MRGLLKNVEVVSHAFVGYFIMLKGYLIPAAGECEAFKSPYVKG
jgi:hypothetical protein